MAVQSATAEDEPPIRYRTHPWRFGSGVASRFNSLTRFGLLVEFPRVGQGPPLWNCASLAVSGVFFSDLHLFSRRSRADHELSMLERVVARADICVLGGDIFDFKWSRWRSLDASVTEAIAWLRRFADASPSCQFHFILGNHDDCQPFVERLDALSRNVPNLQWHADHLRVESRVFLHGDVIDSPWAKGRSSARFASGSGRDLARPGPRIRGWWANHAYDLVVRTRAHRLAIALQHSPPAVARKLIRYLRTHALGPEAGVTDVYFGHTHRVLNGFQQEGLRFHNGGAPIRGLEFRVLTFEDPAGHVDGST